MDLIVTFPGGKKVDAALGEFVIRTDQPVRGGGEGSAPSPFAYCLAAMGTCAGIYVLGYLQARNLPTEGLKIVQSHEADPKTGALTKVSMRIEAPAGIGTEHHAPMIRAAKLCAVKKMIEHQPQFEITAATV
jgi:ribosomal protein S12 methylthiotransferase accessory factor